MKSNIFERSIAEAVSALPLQVQEAMKNVAIVIERRPGKKINEGHLVKTNGCILGLYEGIPLTAWGREFSGKLPDKITIFQEPIEQFAGSTDEISSIVRETVWHEIGHYVGLSDAEISILEKKRKRKKQST